MPEQAVSYARLPFRKVVNVIPSLLTDNATLVTGAAQGNGAAIAKGLTVDLAQDGIRVNAIAPGLISTPMTIPSRSNSMVTEELYQHVLVKRGAEPEELVGAALFLNSPLPSFVTGVTLPVDGEFLAI